MYGAERYGETKENETQVREGTDRRIIIVKQGKARKGKLRERGEVRKDTEKCGEIRCAEKVEKCGNDFSKIMVKVKCHVMSHEVLRYVTNAFIPLMAKHQWSEKAITAFAQIFTQL